MRPLTTTNQHKKMETDTNDKQNTPEGRSDAPTCSLMLVLEKELDRYQPHTNCRRAIQRTIDACKDAALFDAENKLRELATELNWCLEWAPEKAAAKARRMIAKDFP